MGAFSAIATTTLIQEVQHGKSLVSIDGVGIVQRVVSIVAISLEMEESVFWQLAKKEHDKLTVDLKLPGSKLHRGATVRDTVKEVLATKLLPFSTFVKHLYTDRAPDETSASIRYGVPTKYIKYISQAQLSADYKSEDFDDLALLNEQESPTTPMRRSGSSLPRSKNSRTRTLDIQQIPNIFVDRPVYAFLHASETIFYAWLAATEVQLLQSEAGAQMIAAELNSFSKERLDRVADANCKRMTLTSDSHDDVFQHCRL